MAHVESNGILPETQCGFRAGRGTVDMIFTLRMALELARVKKIDLHVVFVDLMKAYDSVNRNGLCGILRAKGVLDTMLDLIKDFYTGKTARVSAEGELTDEFEIRTGLGQGCSMSTWLQSWKNGTILWTRILRCPTVLMGFCVDIWMRSP